MPPLHDYPADDSAHAVDPASIERAQLLRARRGPLVAGSPQWRYLVQTRKLPAAAVRRCAGDLAALDPPVPFFPAHAYGIVSVIRAADGEEIGFAVEACGPAGEAVKTNGRTLRRFFNLCSKRLSGGLFGAVTDQKTDRAVLVEGHLAKAIAAAAVMPGHNVYGFGSRAWLGRAVPPEKDILVIEDRAPDEESGNAE